MSMQQSSRSYKSIAPSRRRTASNRPHPSIAQASAGSGVSSSATTEIEMDEVDAVDAVDEVDEVDAVDEVYERAVASSNEPGASPSAAAVQAMAAELFVGQIPDFGARWDDFVERINR
jgi:hypothetical protein